MQVPVQNKLESLRAWFAACPGAIVALSGGVDSSLVAYVAHEVLGDERSLSVISASASLKMRDLEEARAFCDRYDIPLRIIATEELLDPNYFNNPSNRCYFCKQTLYGDLESIAEELAPAWVLNGTNADDASDYRPGLQAASEFEVHSPLAAVGMGKQDIRDAASLLQLECWDKPASPCLSSRIPYGERVTVEKLQRIEAAENYLNEMGFPVCRVRHAGDSARVEVPPDQVADCLSLEVQLKKKFSELGFSMVEIDLEGFVSGKLNRAIL
jgi:pyridinium-3,5-biscarboxylic acid mononucleotide sulfurtransferase